MLNTLSALVLTTAVAYAQEEDWTIKQDPVGQYLCSSAQFQWGYAKGEEKVRLSRYEFDDEEGVCFLIPKEVISGSRTERRITVEAGYNQGSRTVYSFERHETYKTKAAYESTWSVDLYTQNGSVSLKSSSWEVREAYVDWQRRLGKDKENNAMIVEIPPHIEYRLCIGRAVERVEVTYQRPDRQVDYIILKKGETDELNSETCFMIDQLLVGMDGVFTVKGYYAAERAGIGQESIDPFPVFTKNGFVALKPISDDVKAKPNHYYSKTPPINACKKGREDAISIYFEDRDAKHMKAYAVLKGREISLELIGNANPQAASFFVPRYIAEGYGFTVYAQDVEGNKSKEYTISGDISTSMLIPECKE